MMSRNLLLALSLVFTAAAARLIPHPHNFAPIGAMALFTAAYLRKPWGILVPFLALFLSDLVLNNVVYSAFYPSFTWFTSPWTYLAFAAMMAVGLVAFNGKISSPRIFGASLGASLVFFLVSNFSTFIETNLYPRTPGGLAACYAAGLPFLQNTVMGDLFFSAVLFGAYTYFQRSEMKPHGAGL
jgi:hypothetical protein